MPKGGILSLFIIFMSCYQNFGIQSKKVIVMRLTSPHFEHKKSIPSRFTCQGEDISPELHWDQIPEGTKSFVLIVDDPDAPDPKAPKMIWVHWIIFNIPGDKRKLEVNEQISEKQLGVNDFQNKTQKKYGGPCPPTGEHRYFFKLYALDALLNLSSDAMKEDVVKAMEGHILATAELIGVYQKK